MFDQPGISDGIKKKKEEKKQTIHPYTMVGMFISMYKKKKYIHTYAYIYILKLVFKWSA